MPPKGRGRGRGGPRAQDQPGQPQQPQVVGHRNSEDQTQKSSCKWRNLKQQPLCQDSPKDASDSGLNRAGHSCSKP
ncbi:hypothetical protein TNCV_2311411 [Trichonephila clavipes]|nr:hypothetical protein TNCV_2311411 [Trichonephila clavipes]